jgi:gamma-glutamyltranspeptidase
VLRNAMGSANTIVRTSDGELEGASDLRQRRTLAIGY